MSIPSNTKLVTERSFLRFNLTHRCEHTILLLTLAILLLTGLPQKFRATSWSQAILATPERVQLIQNIHHITAALLALLFIYHLGKIIYLLVRRRLSGDMLPTWQDVKDAFQMIKVLLYLSKEKPAFGKYNFEQKVTYWFIFVSVSILGLSGMILWFPEWFSRFLPGGMIPAARLAHSTESVVLAIFVVVWHFYHVHVERLNLSIFTGKISEEEMKEYHPRHYLQLAQVTSRKNSGDKQ